MAATRKRNHASTLEAQSPGKQTTSQTSIKAFGTVGKLCGAKDDGRKKQKTAHQHKVHPVTEPVPISVDRKRKRVLDSMVEEGSDVKVVSDPQRGVFAQFSKKIKTSTRNVGEKDVPSSPPETPSKGTRALFDRLLLDPTAGAIPFALEGKQQKENSATSTILGSKPCAEHDALAPELCELVELHAAFLSALGLYYAHYGTSSPADVAALLPMVTKKWRKRAITLEDLRKILAINVHDFALQDYGRAGICLVRTQARGRSLTRAAGYVDEDGLNELFVNALQEQWRRWQKRCDQVNRTPTAFVYQLPLAIIVTAASVEGARPIFERGQQRLADLKASQAASQTQSASPTPTFSAEQKTTAAVQSRGTSLLDRILAKQHLTASLPAGPSTEQLERKAALHRIEDISRILDLLLGTQARRSFSLPAVVQQLQQSLKNPISREEVERCLGLMATEITPGFVNVVQSGTVKGVVVCKAGRIGLDQLRARVESKTGV